MITTSPYFPPAATFPTHVSNKLLRRRVVLIAMSPACGAVFPPHPAALANLFSGCGS